MVLFTWKGEKNPLEKCFFFSGWWQRIRWGLKESFYYWTTKQVFQFVIFMLSLPYLDLYATVAHPTYLISTAAELKSNFILHLATLLWDPPDYLQTYVTLLTCLKNGQKTKNNIPKIPSYFPSCRLLHPCHSIKISFGSDKNYIFCVISALKVEIDEPVHLV